MTKNKKTIYYFKYILLNVLMLYGVSVLSSAQEQEPENFKVFHAWNAWSNGGKMLTNFLNEQAFEYLDKREAEVEKLFTKNDWKERQEKVRKALLAHIGPFPEKTPLNPRITGILEKDNFRIEKIIFESVPGNYVTGCLYIPKGITGKRPAIIFTSGHSVLGFRFPDYQTMIGILVKKGFVVFAFDPLGQGERLQYYNREKGESMRGGSTREHSFPGIQCFLAGTSINKYFIWDGIRAIDYLQTRKEVDMSRLGLTGRSGGGTQTVLIAAFDDRIAAAAPENYVTSHRRLLESRGAQDAEQNFYHWLSDGTALEDMLVLMIPKPTLLVATTRDIFSIQGTRETYKEILKGYTAFGREKDFNMAEDHDVHTTTKSNREAVCRFFQKYLNLPGNPMDEEVDILTPQELYVTATGQLSTSLGGETVFSMNKRESEKLYKKIIESREKNKGHLELVIEKSKKLSGYRIPEKNEEVVYLGSYQREGYTVGMYALEGESDEYVIPLLLAVPDGEGIHTGVIYIHPKGKEEGIAAGGNIEKLVKQGYIVAAPDLLGIGETKSDLKFPAAAAFEAILIGRSIVGIQAGDIVRIVNFLKELPDIKTDRIHAVAFGEQCPALLHAAAYEPSINGVALVEAPISYFNISQTRLYDYSLPFIWGVAGSLTAYDLPDLAACVAPRKLAFMSLLNGEKEPASKDLISDQMAFPESFYAKSNPDHFKIIPISAKGVIYTIADWLEK